MPSPAARIASAAPRMSSRLVGPASSSSRLNEESSGDRWEGGLWLVTKATTELGRSRDTNTNNVKAAIRRNHIKRRLLDEDALMYGRIWLYMSYRNSYAVLLGFLV